MPPTVVVTGRDDSITGRQKTHTEEKIAKLERYFNGIVKIEAVLGQVPEGCEVELVISVRGGKPLVCHARARELYAALDLVLDKAEAQLTRHKEKLQGRKDASTAGSGAKREGSWEAEEPRGEPEEEDYQDIVDGRDYS